MDQATYYAIGAGGTLGLLLTTKAVAAITTHIRPYGFLVPKYFFLPLLLRRHRSVPWLLGRRCEIGPWTRAQVATQLTYVGVNVLCLIFNTSTIEERGIRAGQLSLINLVPAYFGFHLSFICTLLQAPLSLYQAFHASTGTMSFLLAVLHVVLKQVNRSTPDEKISEKLYGYIGFACVGSALVGLACRWFLPLYEVFLRFHQGLALTALYALWIHVPVYDAHLRLYLLIMSSVFATTFVIECLWIAYRNFSLHQGSSQVMIAKQGGAIRMTIVCCRPWHFQDCQYVNVWMPISFSSCFQSHPFMIASWSEGPRPCIDLIIEPRDGFTRKLFDIAEVYRDSPVDSSERSIERPFGFARSSIDGPQDYDLHRVIFSGPHGSSARAGDYGTVVLVTEGFSITTVLPVIKGLVQGFNRSTVRTRQVHVLWQLKHLGDQYPAVDLLDRMLEEDVTDHGYILHISIYFEHGLLDPSPQYVGKHQRAAYHNGRVQVRELVDKCTGLESNSNGKRTFIGVSAGYGIREELRKLVVPQLHAGLKYQEFEYQPSGKRQWIWPFSTSQRKF